MESRSDIYDSNMTEVDQSSNLNCKELTNSTGFDEGYGCPPVYDSVLCWPAAPPNTTLSIRCSMALLKLTNGDEQTFSNEASAFRDCLENGTWAKMANYDQCLDEMNKFDFDNLSMMRIVTLITFCGSVLSLVLLLITFYIFVTFRSIQCSRLSVHKNLVIALMMHFILNLVWVEPFVSGVERKPSYRQVLSSTNWLFNEGFYLHSRITVNIFNSDAPFRFFHTLGWGFSAFCVIVWAGVMHHFVDPFLLTNNVLNDDAKCWKGYSNYAYIWILAGPMVAALFLNFVFLINIVRILVTKLRANSTPEADQMSPVNYLTGLQIARPAFGRQVFPHGTERMTALSWWKAMKAVGVLFGYLGFSNFIFFINPKDGGAWEDAYFLINAILQSSQGIVVSILYCFMSADVRLALAKKYYRFKVRWKSRNLRGESSSNHEVFNLLSTDNQRNRRTFQYRATPNPNLAMGKRFDRKASNVRADETNVTVNCFERDFTNNRPGRKSLQS